MKTTRRKLLRGGLGLICLAISVQGGGPGENQFEDLVREVMQWASPYNNLSEIPRKVPAELLQRIGGQKLTDWINEGFKAHPPGPGEQRKSLFSALDLVAIATKGNDFAPLRRMRAQSTREVCHLLQQRAATTNLTLYRLYNEGAILRTTGACVGVDIVLEDENRDLAASLADALDGLLVTHEDGDHFDYSSRLHAELKQRAKPVIVPKDDTAVPLGSRLASGTLREARWTAFRGGHLNLRFSAFFLLEFPRDVRILHSGDNTAWMEFARSETARKIDVFLLKPESIYTDANQPRGVQAAMVETLQRIRPRLVVPHHLLELGHGLDAYGHDMGLRLRGQAPSEVEVLLLHWGESVIWADGRWRAPQE